MKSKTGEQLDRGTRPVSWWWALPLGICAVAVVFTMTEDMGAAWTVRTTLRAISPVAIIWACRVAVHEQTRRLAERPSRAMGPLVLGAVPFAGVFLRDALLPTDVGMPFSMALAKAGIVAALATPFMMRAARRRVAGTSGEDGPGLRDLPSRPSA